MKTKRSWKHYGKKMTYQGNASEFAAASEMGTAVPMGWFRIQYKEGHTTGGFPVFSMSEYEDTIINFRQYGDFEQPDPICMDCDELAA